MPANQLDVIVDLAETSDGRGTGGAEAEEEAYGAATVPSADTTTTGMTTATIPTTPVPSFPVLEASVMWATIDDTTTTLEGGGSTRSGGGGGGSSSLFGSRCGDWLKATPQCDWITKCISIMSLLLLCGSIALIVLLSNRNNDKNHNMSNQHQEFRLPVEEYYALLHAHLSDTRQVEGLEDRSTAVYKALDWMAYQDGPVWQLLDETTDNSGESGGASTILQTRAVEQRFVMAVFYFSTGADFWDPEWLQPGRSECEFWGIFCQAPSGDEGDTMGRNGTIVTSIEIENGSLIGSIPSQLAWLTDLTRLSLTSNRLEGTIPEELVSSLVKLEDLILSFNDLSGTLPSDLTSLTQLVSLSVTKNQLTGSLPLKIPSSLMFFEVSQNPSLSGTLPLQEWSDLFLRSDYSSTTTATSSELTMLDFAETSVTGSIHGPSLATNVFGNLQAFSAYRTKLQGTLPTEVGYLTSLKDFSCSGSSLLTGTIPSEFYQLTLMERFILVDVEMHGGFLEDPKIAQWSQLMALVLTESRLSGTMPTELGLLTKLTDLKVAHTYMTGTIPSELGRLNMLAHGWFHGTQLTGSLPSELCTLPAVQLDWRISCAIECSCCLYCSGS